MWVLARAKPGQITRAIYHLERQSFEHYAPKVKTTTIRRHKLVESVRFLFLNYVFVELEQRWMELRNTYGIGSVVVFGDAPEPVDPAIIADLRALEGPDGYFHFDTKPEGFQPGQRLRVTGGLLENKFCQYICQQGAQRARVMTDVGVVTLPLKDLAAAVVK